MTIVHRRALLKGAGAGALALPGLVRPGRAAEPLRIGAVLPLSGPADLIGRNLRVGVEIARDQINAEGGVLGRPIELVFRDDKASPAQSLGAVRELAADGVHLVVGSPVSSSAAAVMPVLASIDSILMVTGSTSPSLTHELFVRNMFRVSDSGPAQANALAKLMTERYPDVVRWAGVLPDAASGHAGWDTFVAYLQKQRAAAGKPPAEVLDPTLTKLGATDFKPQAFRLLAQEPQGLLNMVYGGDGITMFGQMKTLGLSDKLRVVVDLAIEIDLALAVKDRLPPNVWSFSHGYLGAHLDNPLAVAVLAEATKRTGEPMPSSFIGLSNSAVRALAGAITATQSTDTGRLIEALETQSFDTVKGRMRFRKEDHAQLSTIDLLNMGPKASPPGWEVKEFMKIPTETVIEAPSPGTPLKI